MTIMLQRSITAGAQTTGLDVASVATRRTAPVEPRSSLGQPRSLRGEYIGKRIFDVIGASLILLAAAPLFLFVALAVRRDGGPALYGHLRVGRGGQMFRCLKFRSMVVDSQRRLEEHLRTNEAARHEWEATFKLKDDPRVTRIGRFLRKTSLDELPQLFNVIRGEMSLVGPRPIVKAELERYGNCQDVYTSVRPGMTGLWQVSGRSDTSYATRVRLDVDYVAKQSFVSDLSILVRTAKVVAFSRGAY